MVVQAQLEEHERRNQRLARMSAPPAPMPPTPARTVIAWRDYLAERQQAAKEGRFRELLDQYRLTFESMPKTNVRKIQREVAGAVGITLNDLLSPRKTRGVAFARQFAIWRVRKETTLSLPQIGRLFGGRDHTTILHACRKIDGMIADGSLPAEFKKMCGEGS